MNMFYVLFILCLIILFIIPLYALFLEYKIIKTLRKNFPLTWKKLGSPTLTFWQSTNPDYYKKMFKDGNLFKINKDYLNFMTSDANMFRFIRTKDDLKDKNLSNLKLQFKIVLVLFIIFGLLLLLFAYLSSNL